MMAVLDSIPKGHPTIHAPAGRTDFVRYGIPKGHPTIHALAGRADFVR